MRHQPNQQRMFLAAALLLGLMPGFAWAQCDPEEIDKILTDVGVPGAGFGGALAISRETIIAGAQNDGEYGPFAGAAYIFRADGTGNWIQEQRLTASDAGELQSFGCSVAIDGDTAVIGAYGDEQLGSSAGAAYVFRRTSRGEWVETQKLTAPDGAVGDSMGSGVALFDDTAFIGCSGDDLDSDNQGSVYVFQKDGTGHWVHTQKLVASDGGQSMEAFGLSVAINGRHAIVGAPISDNFYGRCYIFEEDESGIWSEVAVIHCPIGGDPNVLGWVVDIAGDVAVAGGEDGWAAVISNEDWGWHVVEVLHASDADPRDYFGNVVAVSEDTVLVGALRNYVDDLRVGSAYLFLQDNHGEWVEVERIEASDGQADDGFGSGVALQGSTAIIGAANVDDNGDSAGAVYVIETNCNRIQGDLNGDGCVDQSDLGLLLASYELDAGGDVDGDGDTDQSDLGILLVNYERGC